MGYSPQDHKESDTTERLHFHFHTLSVLAWRIPGMGEPGGVAQSRTRLSDFTYLLT